MHQILHLVTFALLHFSPAASVWSLAGCFYCRMNCCRVAFTELAPYLVAATYNVFGGKNNGTPCEKKDNENDFSRLPPTRFLYLTHPLSHPPSQTHTLTHPHMHTSAYTHSFSRSRPLFHHILFRNSNSSKLVSSKLSLKTPFKWFSVVQVRVRKGVQLHFVASRFQQKEFWVGVNCSSICGAWIRSEFLSGASLVSYLEGTHFPVRYAIEWQEIIHLVLLLYRNEQSLYLNKRFRMIPYMQCSQA